MLKGTLFNCKLAKLVVGRLLVLLIRNREEVANSLDDPQIDCRDTQPEEVGEVPRCSVRYAEVSLADDGAKNCEPVVESTRFEMSGVAELYTPWDEDTGPTGAMFELYWSVHAIRSPTLARVPEELVTVPVMS